MSIVTWTEPHFKSHLVTRKRVKGRKARAEVKVKRAVRAECVTRDGHCLVATRIGIVGECRGQSVWSHFAGHRRSQTRGMAPERRHTTLFSGMLCQRHDRLEETGQYEVVYRTVDYANGSVDWQRREPVRVVRKD